MASCSPGAPTRTGQTPTFRQAAVAARRVSGGSVNEKNFPSRTLRTACMATSDRIRASSRLLWHGHPACVELNGLEARVRPVPRLKTRTVRRKADFFQPFRGDFRGAFQRFLIADNDRRDPPVRAAERFQGVAGRGGERLDFRSARMHDELERPDGHFAFYRLLPALISRPVQQQRIDGLVDGILSRGQFVAGNRQHADGALREVQESQLDFQGAGFLVRSANRPRGTRGVLRGFNPCGTRHFPGGSLHAPCQHCTCMLQASVPSMASLYERGYRPPNVQRQRFLTEGRYG